LKKDAETLESELRRASQIEDYLAANDESFVEETVAELMARTFVGKGITKAELARRSGSSTVYVHQVFAGRRCPSRDKVICLCIGMGADLSETQDLLKAAGYAPLYATNRRDAVVMFGLMHGKALEEIDEKLDGNQLEMLS